MEVEVHIMCFLASIDLIVQRLVLPHSSGISLFLSTIVGVDNHIIHNGLAPNGSSTTGNIVVSIAVTTMVGFGLFGVGHIDVLAVLRVEEHTVEVIISLPFRRISIGNSNLSVGIIAHSQQREKENRQSFHSEWVVDGEQFTYLLRFVFVAGLYSLLNE